MLCFIGILKAGGLYPRGFKWVEVIYCWIGGWCYDCSFILTIHYSYYSYIIYNFTPGDLLKKKENLTFLNCRNIYHLSFCFMNTWKCMYISLSLFCSCLLNMSQIKFYIKDKWMHLIFLIPIVLISRPILQEMAGALTWLRILYLLEELHISPWPLLNLRTFY